MKSCKHKCCAPSRLKKKKKKKWSFRPFRLRRRCLDLCMIIYVLTNAYKAILGTGDRGVNNSGVSLNKAHPHPQFYPRYHHSFIIPTADSKLRMSSPSGPGGFTPCLGGCTWQGASTARVKKWTFPPRRLRWLLWRQIPPSFEDYRTNTL